MQIRFSLLKIFLSNNSFELFSNYIFLESKFIVINTVINYILKSNSALYSIELYMLLYIPFGTLDK